MTVAESHPIGLREGLRRLSTGLRDVTPRNIASAPRPISSGLPLVTPAVNSTAPMTSRPAPIRVRRFSDAVGSTKSSRMAGIATLTIVVSRMSMNVPMTNTIATTCLVGMERRLIPIGRP